MRAFLGLLTALRKESHLPTREELGQISDEAIGPALPLARYFFRISPEGKGSGFSGDPPSQEVRNWLEEAIRSGYLTRREILKEVTMLHLHWKFLRHAIGRS